MQQGRLTSIPYLCLEIFLTVFLFGFWCAAMHVKPKKISYLHTHPYISFTYSYSHKWLILLSAFSTNDHFRIFRLHLLIEFIICTNKDSLCHFFLCQMTNGSFSRTWIFNELLRSIRIVRVKENSKICWKNCTSFNLLEWYRNANVFTTAIIQWKKNWAANTLVWWNRYSASADTSNLHMEMNCFPSWRFFFLRFFL